MFYRTLSGGQRPSAVLGSTPAAVFINSTYVDNYLSKYNPNARSLASVFTVTQLAEPMR
jgi:hypothetical protein